MAIDTGTKKSHIVLTCDGKQVTDVLQEIKELRAKSIEQLKQETIEYKKMEASGKATEDQLKTQADLVDLLTKKVEAYGSMHEQALSKSAKIKDVIDNLGEATDRQLKQALGNGRSLISALTGSDEDLAKADEIREQMAQIMRQMKLIEGEYVNIAEGLGNISIQSDKWLSKAIKQQGEYLNGLKKDNAEYTSGLAVLRQLTAEDEKRRLAAKTTEKGMNGHQARQILGNIGGNSVDQVNEAIRVMEQLQKKTNAGSSVWKAYEDRIRAAKEELAKLQGKVKEVAETGISQTDLNQRMASLNAQSETSMKQMLKYLQDAKSNLEPYTDEWIALGNQIERVKQRMADVASPTDYTKDYRSARNIAYQDRLDFGNGKTKDVTKKDLQWSKDYLQKELDVTPVADTAKIKEIQDALGNIDARMKALAGDTEKALLTQQRYDEILANVKDKPLEDLKKASQMLVKELEKLPPASEDAVVLRKQLREIDREIKQVADDAVNVADVIERSKKGKASIAELKQAYKQLEDELQRIENTTGSTFKDKQRDLQDLKKKIDDATGAVHKQGGAWNTALKNLTAYVGLFAVFNQVKQYFTDLFRLNMQFSDQLVNIRKVSGLAMTDIERLSGSLAKLDTRTTVQELNDIAYAGAKLGIGDYGVSALEGFARAANQVNVALKEDLGEEALTALAKIGQVSGDMDKLGVEQSMLKIGSSIFRLASTTTATSDKIVDFSNRLLAMGKEGALSTADILALGAAVDAMALEPEVASTAFNKMIVEIRKGTSSLETDLGLVKGSLKDLVEKGRGMEALQTVFHAMAGKENVFALENLFGDLGSEGGARMVKTMVTMANSVEMLDKAVTRSNKAFKEGSAVTVEYNMQQETAAAYMERAANMWEKQFINATNANGPIKQIAQSWYEMTESLLGAGKASGGFTLALNTLVMVIKMGINLLPLFISFLTTKGIAAAFTALTPIVSSFCSVTYAGLMSIIAALKSGATITGLFTAKWKAMDAAMKANVIGLVVSLFAQLVYWASQYERELTSIEKAQRKVNEIHEQAVSDIQAETTKLTTLNKMAHDQNVILEDRKKAIDMLNDIVPDYNGQLDETTGKYKANEEALKKYNDQLLRNAEIEGAKSAISDLSGKLANAEGKRFKIQQELENTPEPTAGGNNSVLAYSNSQYLYQSGAKIGVQNRLKDATKEVEDYRAELNALKERYEKDIAQSYVDVKTEGKKTADNNDAGKSSSSSSTTKTNNEEKIAKDRANALIANIKAFYEEQQRKYLEWVAQMNANGETVSEGQQKEKLSYLETRMNIALGSARQSISTLDDGWKKFYEHMDEDVMVFDDETSRQLLDSVGKADINGLHDLFTKLSGDLSRENNRTLSENLGALLDQIFANGSKELRQAAEKVLARQRELQKILNEHDYTGNVDRATRSDLDQLGLLNPANGISTDSQEGLQKMNNAFDAIAKKARESVAELYAIDPESDNFKEKFLEFMSVASDTFDFASLNAQQLMALYIKLRDYSDEYTEAIKRRDDRNKKINEKNLALKEEYQSMQRLVSLLEQYSELNSSSGMNLRVKTNDEGEMTAEQGSYGYDLGKKFGFSYDPESDPEILLMRARLAVAKTVYEEQKQLLEAGKTDQDSYNDAMKNYMSAMVNYGSKVHSSLSSQISNINTLMQPVMDFGDAVGEAFATMSDDAEAGKKALKSALKQMVKSFAQQSLQMFMQNEQERAAKVAHYSEMLLLQKTFNAAEVQGEVTQGVTLNTLRQAQNTSEIGMDITKMNAKAAIHAAGIFGLCVSQLGPIAGPIAYSAMMAILSGLISFAISSAFGSDSSSDTASTPSTKLVSGMLTYDKGNLQQLYIGNDGRIYSAQEQREGLSTGIVDHPIATTVNGQPALVGEQGPELVVGRETTAAMMHNAPQLLQMLLQFDKNRTMQGMGGMGLFDAGNVQQVLGEQNIGNGTQDNAALVNVLAQMHTLLQTLNRDGVKAQMNMYGRNGAYSQMQRATTFMKGR